MGQLYFEHIPERHLTNPARHVMEIERSKNHAISPKAVPRANTVLERLLSEVSGTRGEYLQWFRQCTVADPNAGGIEQEVTWRVRRAIFDNDNDNPQWESQIKKKIKRGVYRESIIDLNNAADLERYLENFSPEGVVLKTRFSFGPELLELMVDACPKRAKLSLPDIGGIKQFDFDIVHNPSTRMLVDPNGRVIPPSDGLKPQLLTRSPIRGYKLVNGVLFREEQEFEDVESMEACDIGAIRKITKAFFAAQGLPLQPSNDGQRSAAQRVFENHTGQITASPCEYYYGKDATPAERGSLVWRSVGLDYLIKPTGWALAEAA